MTLMQIHALRRTQLGHHIVGVKLNIFSSLSNDNTSLYSSSPVVSLPPTRPLRLEVVWAYGVEWQIGISGNLLVSLWLVALILAYTNQGRSFLAYECPPLDSQCIQCHIMHCTAWDWSLQPCVSSSPLIVWWEVCILSEWLAIRTIRSTRGISGVMCCKMKGSCAVKWRGRVL